MKEAIILAGGLGTRLQSVVNDRPKCMATVAQEPFLKYIFDYLHKANFTHVILALGYKSEFVLDWLSKVSYTFEVSYVIEEEPLGTGGAIKYAFEKSKSTYAFVFNGDTFFDIDTCGLEKFHTETKSDITLALKPKTDFDRYGSVDIDGTSRITRFNEKQYQHKGLINGGVYLINKSIFNSNLPTKFSFEKDILEHKIEALNIYGFIQDSYFIDIGIPSDYDKANIDFIFLK
ncbi:MAG: hypothetical protein RL662_916 [Bacteroidota bacterium]|jgi:D-glycero-alpha-D-manno-heptose 1-phosphate guanylyltransferase